MAASAMLNTAMVIYEGFFFYLFLPVSQAISEISLLDFLTLQAVQSQSEKPSEMYTQKITIATESAKCFSSPWILTVTRKRERKLHSKLSTCTTPVTFKDNVTFLHEEHWE